MHERAGCRDEAANHQLPIVVAFWVIWIVSTGECSSLTESLMQICCSTRSVILNVTVTQYTYMLTQWHLLPPWQVQWSCQPYLEEVNQNLLVADGLRHSCLCLFICFLFVCFNLKLWVILLCRQGWNQCLRQTIFMLENQFSLLRTIWMISSLQNLVCDLIRIINLKMLHKFEDSGCQTALVGILAPNLGLTGHKPLYISGPTSSCYWGQ